MGGLRQRSGLFGYCAINGEVAARGLQRERQTRQHNADIGPHVRPCVCVTLFGSRSFQGNKAHRLWRPAGAAMKYSRYCYSAEHVGFDLTTNTCGSISGKKKKNPCFKAVVLCWSNRWCCNWLVSFANQIREEGIQSPQYFNLICDYFFKELFPCFL